MTLLNPEDFPKPLNQFIEEDVPVMKHKYDPETKKIVSTYEMQKQKTMYINAPKEKIRCKNGEHVFKVIDIHKYVFKCTKCPFLRKVYPTTYSFDEKTGALTHLVTGVRI